MYQTCYQMTVLLKAGKLGLHPFTTGRIAMTHFSKGMERRKTGLAGKILVYRNGARYPLPTTSYRPPSILFLFVSHLRNRRVFFCSRRTVDTSWACIHRATSRIAVCAALVLCSVVAHANAITYRVNRSIATATISGFITTDGSTGILSAANIIDWNLTLSDGTVSSQLTGPLSGNNSSVFVRGFDVAAFDNLLLFNFSGIDYGVLLFGQNRFGGNHYYCDSTQPFECSPGETIAPMKARSVFRNENIHGNVVIGVATPEPVTLTLVISGVGVLFSLRKLS